jgi:oligopeptide/dipeptide ABC transporter ATP-binding protein
MLADGRRNMAVAPWLAIIPGLAIMLTVLAINLTADGAADVLDPRLRKGAFRRLRQRREGGDGADGSVVRSATATSTPSEQPITAMNAMGSGTAHPDPHPNAAALVASPPILRIEDLHVEFPVDDRVIRAVRGVSFEVRRGQTLGIVGESGSGKSVTALSIIQLLDAPGRVTGGRILFEGQDVSRIDDRAMAALRGSKIGMIFQNPAASLDPVMSVGAQLVETIEAHERVASSEAWRRARAALLAVGIGDPDRVMRRYPFQLSGGMNQRVMISMAMLTRPDLLIADEPTTALDVTTQAQVLDQLAAITREHDTALILITHDIALVSEYVDEVIVMYAGRICERGPVASVIERPRHPYTQALLQSVPRADLSSEERLTAIPGELPDPAARMQGCPFAPRCRYVMDVCRVVDPTLSLDGPEHAKACHLPGLPDDVHGNAA